MEKEEIKTALAELQKMIHEAAIAKGWWPELKGAALCRDHEEVQDMRDKINVGEKLALVHSEVSEANDSLTVAEIGLYNIRRKVQEIVSAEVLGIADGKFRLADIHSAISRALEAARQPVMLQDEHCPVFTNFAIELADAVIRIFNLCGAFGIPLGEAIFAKVAANAERPYRHGKRF